MSLATDPQAFKRLTIESAIGLRVRELSRTLDNLGNERRRLSNQLRDLLVSLLSRNPGSLPGNY